jgi:hypothetical protein
MTYLGALWIAYGFANQKQHDFLATGLTPTEKDPVLHSYPHGDSTFCGRRAKGRRKYKSRAIGLEFVFYGGQTGTLDNFSGSQNARG